MIKRFFPLLLLAACGVQTPPAAVVRNDSGSRYPDSAHGSMAVSKRPDSIQPAAKRPWGPVNYITDLNNDKLPDTIILSSGTGDTATFDTVSIVLAGLGKKTFHTTEHWESIDPKFLDSGRNALPTKRFFLARTTKQSVLLFFGYLDGAGYREEFSILNIENNAMKLVLNQNERHIDIEIPIELKDVDGDGRLDFIYREYGQYDRAEDSLGGKIGSYAPYYIYTVDDDCLLNKALTEQYNREHYVFAGFKYDESIDVFYPNDGSKPRLLKKK